MLLKEASHYFINYKLVFRQMLELGVEETLKEVNWA